MSKGAKSESSGTPGDPLIDPIVLKLASLIKSDRVTPDELARLPYPKQQFWVDSRLLPFVTSPSLSTLAAILRDNPWLYWHPLVRRQIIYLLKLTRNQAEWERLGWEPQVDQDGAERPPKEVVQVRQALRELIQAHVVGLVPGQRIGWKPKAKKRGRPSGIKNPYPPGLWAETIDGRTLDESERTLRRFFAERQAELVLRPSEPKGNAIDRIAKLVVKVLNATDAAWWSDRKEYIERIYRTKQADTDPREWHIQIRWTRLDLSHSLDPMLDGTMGKLGKEGKAAYLSYVVLSALLEVKPQKIQHTLDNFRHPRRRR